MRPHEISIVQKIANLVNSKQDFSYDVKLNTFETDKNYGFIVSTNNILTAKNPSLNYDIQIIIRDAIKKYEYHTINDIIGGWLNKETNIYHLDFGSKFYTMDAAIDMGKIYKQQAIYDIQNDKVINIIY